MLPDGPGLVRPFPLGSKGFGVDAVIDHDMGFGPGTQPFPLLRHDKVAAGEEGLHRYGRIRSRALPFSQDVVGVVHVEEHREPGEPFFQVQGEQGPVMHMQEVRNQPAHQPGHPAVVQGQEVAVAAVKPPLPGTEAHPPVGHPAPLLLVRQVRVGGPDDHGPVPGQVGGQGVYEQFRGPAPDRRDGKKLRPDQGDGMA